jgi:hypothetical protein
MKKLIITASAISLVAFAAMASAEQTLSASEMDGITAAGSFGADAIARARGLVTDTTAETNGLTETIGEVTVGQVGKIEVVRTNGYAYTRAFATGSFADAEGQADGTTEGTGMSDVQLNSVAEADTQGQLSPARISAYSFNGSYAQASEVVLGRFSSADSSAYSVAIIGN